MKKLLAILLVLGLGFSVFGCGKKETAEEGVEPMTMEALTAINATTVEVKPVTAQPQMQPAQPAKPAELAPLPPAGPYNPTGIEIQTALKNAGFYTGPIDGKIGPMSKKAIEAFQKANSLQVDGKVGPKTWTALSKYLNPAPAPTGTTKKR